MEVLYAQARLKRMAQYIIKSLLISWDKNSINSLIEQKMILR